MSASAGAAYTLIAEPTLAGANRRAASAGGDGILTTEEVALLDLEGVSTVVLSACETGVGALRAGEGVAGIQRAFRIAGAGTALVASLWPVEDARTRAWMAAFYDAWLHGGLPPATAVQEAMRRGIGAARRAGQLLHPFGWGAFVAARAPGRLGLAWKPRAACACSPRRGRTARVPAAAVLHRRPPRRHPAFLRASARAVDLARRRLARPWPVPWPSTPRPACCAYRRANPQLAE